MGEQRRVPARVRTPTLDESLEQANAARVYDVFLGGSCNFAADRVVAGELSRLIPGAAGNAVANRRFMGRAVRYLIGCGVRQFVDLGSGLPTAGAVHQVAQSADPSARVLYVDCDPVAVEQSWRILADNRRAAVMSADLRDPVEVLDSPEAGQLLNLSAPVGLLACCALHFVPVVDDPAGVLRAYTDRLALGSHLVISHVTAEHSTPEQTARAEAVYDASGSPVTPRTPAQITRLFDEFDLLDPGVVPVGAWRPDENDDPDATGSDVYGGVGMLLRGAQPRAGVLGGFAGINVTYAQTLYAQTATGDPW
jgi:hypothetical protein